MAARALMVPVVAALALAGCATNTLRLDRATTLGTAGTHAAQATAELLDRVDAANRETAIDVATLDPACALPTPLIASAGSSGPPAFICRAGPRAPGDFELRRLDRRAFAPALTVLDALADYLGVIDAIVSEEPVDAGAVFLDAEGKLSQAAAALAAVTGSDAPPALTDAQSKAVAGALTLIGTLAQEADKVARLKAIERDPAQGERFAATIADLRAANRAWTAVLASEVGKQSDVADFVIRRGLKPDAAHPVPLPGARDLRARQMDLIDRTAEVAALGPALDKAVDALDKAHADYRALLFNANAPKTKAERRRAAKLIEARVMSAIEAVVGLAKAF